MTSSRGASGSEAAPDVLRDQLAGQRVVRGSAARLISYGAGALFTAAASVLLLRHLGVEDFGRYALVMAIVAIVSGVTDAGLTVIGNRELARLPLGIDRRRLLGDLLGLRILLTPAGVAAAAGFALLAGYPEVVVAGIALAGAGLVLVNTQATLMQMLAVEMRNLRLSMAEVYRQAATLAVIAVLVVGNAGLTAFFTGQIFVGVAMLVATPLLIGRSWAVRPRFRRAEWRRMLSESIPLAISYALSLIYFRVLLIELSFLSDAVEVGLFGTSLRIFELLLGLPTMVFGVALPVLAASAGDSERMRYQVQRLTEAALLASSVVTIVVAATAAPVIHFLGGAQYDSAAAILRLQVIAFVPVFVGNVFQTALVALGHQRVLVVVNAAALCFLLTIGIAAISLADAQGAAIAAIVSECALTALTYVALSRKTPDVVPNLAFAWRVAVAAAAASFVGFLVGLPDLVAGVLAGATFVAVAVFVRAVPAEIPQSLRLGRFALRRS